MTIKKIPIQKIKLGMYLVGIDVSWMKSPFLRHRFMIKDKEEVIILIGIGVKVVDIDIDKSSYDFNKSTESPQSVTPTPLPVQKVLKPNSTTKELGIAKILEVHSKKAIKLNFDSITESTGNLKVDEMIDIVGQSHESILRNANALLSLFHVAKKGDTFINYAFNNMSLALLLGQRMDLSDEELMDLGTAALLMDVGWLKLDDGSFQQPSEYTQTEYEINQQHIDLSVDILENSDFKPTIVDLIVKHHERVDGTGYYSNYTSEDIPLGSQILSLVDHYNSQILGCYDSQKVLPASALRKIYKNAKQGSHDLGLVELLIQLVGIYPISSAVELNTGEKGVVTKVNWRDSLKPTVNIYYRSSGESLLNCRVTDLFKQNDPQKERSIRAVLNPANAEHDPAGILNYDV